MDDVVKQLVTIGTAIIGVAIIAVLVSKNANTSGVVQSIGNAYAQDLAVAVSPVTGGGGMGAMGYSF